MKEALVRTSIETEFGKIGDLSLLKEDIEKGLDLEKGIESRETRDVISESLAQTFDLSGKIFDIPMPKVKNLYPWGDRKEENININIFGKCDSSEWSIYISPFFLKNAANAYENKKPYFDVEISLVELGAHEIYHLYQSTKWPNTFERNGQVDLERRKKILLAGVDLKRWYKPTPSEKGADIYGKVFSNALAWERVQAMGEGTKVCKYIDNLDHLIFAS